MQACLNIAERRRFNAVNFGTFFIKKKVRTPPFYQEKGTKQLKISTINKHPHYVQKNVYIPHTVLPVIPFCVPKTNRVFNIGHCFILQIRVYQFVIIPAYYLQ
jgi:hypothetical protein